VCPSSNDGVHRLTFPADGTFNPFPSFGFSGLLRPVYPLSLKRVVPDHIPRPDYAEDGSPAILISRLTSRLNKYFQGIPISETKRTGQPPRILSPEEQEKMRTVCRVGACLTLQA
jgi:methionyl aminopeptidase